MQMPWIVEFHDDFEPEFFAFDSAVQDALLAVAKLLADFGRGSVDPMPIRSTARSSPI
jgi:hypothetical protein